MTLVPSRQFEKKVKKLPTEIRHALRDRLLLFAENPHHPLLNNHPLHGSFRHYRSINVTGDYRLVCEEYERGLWRLIDIDTHHGLYGA